MDFLVTKFSGGSFTEFEKFAAKNAANFDLMIMFYQFCKKTAKPTTLFFDPKVDFIDDIKKAEHEVNAVPILKESKFNISNELLDSYKEYDYENYCFLVNVLNHFDVTIIDDVVRVFTVNVYSTFDDFAESDGIDENALDAFIVYMAEFIEANCDCEEEEENKQDDGPLLAESKFNIPKELLTEFKAYNYDSYCYFINILNKYSTNFINHMVNKISNGLYTNLNDYMNDPILDIDAHVLYEFAIYISDYIQNSEGECVDFEDHEENE